MISVLYGPYASNVFSYWDQRHDENVLFIKYEDMKADLRIVVNKVANFLNKTITDEQMDKLLKHLSFESMQNNNACNKEDIMELTERVTGKFIRKGIAGDYVNAMTPEIIKQFDEWYKRNNLKILYGTFV